MTFALFFNRYDCACCKAGAVRSKLAASLAGYIDEFDMFNSAHDAYTLAFTREEEIEGYLLYHIGTIEFLYKGNKMMDDDRKREMKTLKKLLKLCRKAISRPHNCLAAF